MRSTTRVGFSLTKLGLFGEAAALLFLMASIVSIQSPALAAAKRNKGLKLPAPEASMPRAEIEAARSFAQACDAHLGEALTSYSADVQSDLQKLYPDEAAKMIKVVNRRNGKVIKLTRKALAKFISQTDKLLEAAQVRAQVKSKSPFGPALNKLPGRKAQELLRLARIELGEMESFGYECRAEIDALQGAAASDLKGQLAEALLTAFAKDISEIVKLTAKVDRLRYSTAGVTPWQSEEIPQGTFMATTREIQLGHEYEYRLGITIESATRTFLIRFEEIQNGQSFMTCNAVGQGDPQSGIRFEGPTDSPICGDLDLTIDARGRIAGKTTYTPPEVSGWHPLEIQIEGLVRKNGVAEISSRTLYQDGEGSSGQFHNETVFEAGS